VEPESTTTNNRVQMTASSVRSCLASDFRLIFSVGPILSC